VTERSGRGVERSAVARLALFAAALVVSGLVGAGLGAAVGPIDVGGDHDPAPSETVPGAPTTDHGGHGDDAGEGQDGHVAPDAEHDGGHDIEEPFEVPEIGPEEGGS
jgi:hypothetical protein